jgi:hypothetical protein
MPKAQTTETLETPSGPRCANKDQTRKWRSDDTKVDATRKMTLYQRSENPHKAISTIGWFSPRSSTIFGILWRRSAQAQRC